VALYDEMDHSECQISTLNIEYGKGEERRGEYK
jgi:hypothetical protein